MNGFFIRNSVQLLRNKLQTKTFLQFFLVFFRHLQFTHLIERRIELTIIIFDNHQIIYINNIRLMNLHEATRILNNLILL